MTGIMQYCTDLGVSVEDAGCFIVMEAAQIEFLGEMTKDAFVKGWKEV